MPEPDRHAEQRNIVESILRHIPGFRGYLEKEYRRESDYLARVWLADQMQTAKGRLDEFMRTQVDSGDIDQLPSLERIRTRLDGLMSKMRGDVRGYSGFFDYVRVDESLLDKVYEHDMSLMSDATSLVELIENLRSLDDASSSSATDVLQHVESIENKYSQRGDMLKGIGS